MNGSEQRKSPKRAPKLLALATALLVGVASAVACGVDDVHTSSTPPGSGGENSKGGTSATGNASGMGVVAGETGVGDAGNTPEPCSDGDKQCGGKDGNTPQTCDAHGTWQDSPDGPCAGSTPVCAGQGTCAAYRLVNAGIDSLGVRTDPVALKGGQMMVLKEQSLSATPRTCAMVKGKQLCVTGGIR